MQVRHHLRNFSNLLMKGMNNICSINQKWVREPSPDPQEIKEFTAKLEKGLRIAEKRMLEEKALHNETVVVSNSEGKIEYIPAKEVLAAY